jgi:hypothetical protein
MTNKEIKHTPAPWHVSEYGGYLHVWTDSEETYDVFITKNATEEEKANARPIAAAPELLEALEDALAGLLEDPVNNRKRYLRAQTAIAKAKGE